MKSTLRLAALAALVALTSRAALAGNDNRGTQGQMFDPNSDDLGVLTSDSPEVLDPLAISLGLILDRARNPVESGSRNTQRTGNLVRETTVLNVLGAIGLPFGLSLGFQVPMTLDQDGFELNQPTQRFEAVGLGDIRLDLKWQAFVSSSAELSIGFKFFGTLPSGEADDFRSEDKEGSAGALVLIEKRWERFRALAELGYQWIEEDSKVGGVTFDDRLLFGLALEGTIYRLGGDPKKSEGSAREDDAEDAEERRARALREPGDELIARVALDSAFRAESPRTRQSSPLELLYSLAFRAASGWTFELGGGTGLSAGVGAPDYRFFVALRFSFGGPKPGLKLFAEPSTKD